MVQLMPGVNPAIEPERGVVCCGDCGAWFDPSKRGSWRCPECQNPGSRHGSVFAVQDGFCPACGAECRVIRRGYETSRTFCDCHLTASQRERFAAQERERQRSRQVQREMATAQRMQDAELAQHKREAAECLADPEVMDRAGGPGQCREARPPAHRFAFCTSCRVNTGALR